MLVGFNSLAIVTYMMSLQVLENCSSIKMWSIKANGGAVNFKAGESSY